MFSFKKPEERTDPIAFFSYGMTKCGTTLAFELTRTALIEAGIHQESIPFRGDAPRRLNFIPELTEDRAEDIRTARANSPTPVAVKTHGRPSPTMVLWIESGEGIGHAIFRDPRDMALSMIDAGRAARETGRPAFSEIHTLEDACKGIANQLDSLSAWLQMPGILPLQYEQFAFDTEAGAARILEQLRLDGNPRRIARKVARADKTLRNKAIPERHRQELPDAQGKDILARFAPFYDVLFNRPAIKLPLPPGTDFNAPQKAEF